ncbi:alcohol dehydrogenase catalytic domain-containing protein [Haloechinothrix sp. LS1_15]|uniref:alcohol dehydrogenase catalytic domain-containing protein n=1 Tax=Haloechinothrix sp. LS1_15 TaxID=2652248 RepID=UPI002946E9C1|nr:zinc-binding dehydrogenase [Haloechinothrix sp. LS1_15]MDV6011612.1 zinc-binding dehydrogenase [Haloechinothrix sp. LS1_15]
MYAIRQHEFGPAEVLRYEEVPEPEPGPGQVRIRMEAAGVHWLDAVIRAGAADRLPFPLPELPIIPGREVAGRIDELGSGVDRAWLGSRVVTHLGLVSGAYAEFAVRELQAVHPLPSGVTSEVAVAMIGAGRIAIGITSLAQVSPDDVVIVTDAGGGVGYLVAQAARNSGAATLALVDGSAAGDRVYRMGVEAVVDCEQPAWQERLREELGPREATIVFDGVGGDVGTATLELLRVGGQFVMHAWRPANGPPELSSDEIYGRGLTASAANGERLDRRGGSRCLEAHALAEAGAGRLTPALHSFHLADAAKAHRALEAGETRGTVVLTA